MKKLETLRDIELYHKINPDVKDDYDVLYDELKESAKEWIKYLETLSDEYEEHREEFRQIMDDRFAIYSCVNDPDNGEVIKWITYFFNLDVKDEEEDKKDKN